MDPISWLQTVLSKFLSIFNPPDARVVLLVFYGVGIYLFANYGTLNNETIIMWSVGTYIFYALADPSMGEPMDDDVETDSSESSDEDDSEEDEEDLE